MREQDGWDEHAAYMDALTEEGFIVLGGPLEGDAEVLLICAAASAGVVRDRLNADVWTAMGLLEEPRIERWTVLMDGRAAG